MNVATINSETLPRSELNFAQRDAMFGLLARHFDGVTRAQFDNDLAHKNQVVLLTRDGQLAGFSTLLAYETEFEGEPVSVVYSGDTIVAPEAWGSMALPRAWIAAVNGLRAELPRGRFYWLLITSGFRTYRFLPVFWREFYPRFDRPTPRLEQRMLAHLARERFGPRFDPAAGIVRFAQPQRLRDELSEIAPGRKADPHIEFFLTRNPGHARGDELACLTEICPENLTAAGRRMVTPRELHCHAC